MDRDDWKRSLYADGRSVTLSYDGNGNLAGYNDCTDCVSASSIPTTTWAANCLKPLIFGAFSKSFGYTYYPGGQKKNFTAPDGLSAPARA